MTDTRIAREDVLVARQTAADARIAREDVLVARQAAADTRMGRMVVLVAVMDPIPIATQPAVVVEVAWGHGLLDATPTWTDESTFFRSGNTSRGRSSRTGRFETGTATLLLDNRTGRFTPDNTQGANSPNVKLGVPVRVTATWQTVTYPLFYGTVRAWPLDYPPGGFDATVPVPLVDGFYSLNLEDLAGKSYPEQFTDARIGAVLDDIGWPAALRNIEAGVATVQAVTFDDEETALNHLLEVAESEVGVLFMSADGKVTFYNRTHFSGGLASQATYDGGDDYTHIDLAYDDDFFWNVARVTREGGETQEASAVATNDTRRVLSRTGVMVSDAAALNVAEWLVAMFGTVSPRIDRLRFKPLRDATLMTQMLDFGLREAVTAQLVPSAGDPFTQISVIETVAHSIAPADWTTTWTLSPLSALETTDFWILGTDALGTGTVLA